MLYLLYQYLISHGDSFPLLNLMKYLTFRSGMSMVTGYVVAVAMGSRFIRWMKTKQGKGQPIREEGIQRHVLEKAGTPTMGGFMILAGLTVGTLLWADLRNLHVWVVLFVTAAFGLLGFMDDYAKVTKQTTEGVSGRDPAAPGSADRGRGGDRRRSSWYGSARPRRMTPNLGDLPSPSRSSSSLLINLGWFYLAFGAFIIVGGFQCGELHRRPRRPGHRCR